MIRMDQEPCLLVTFVDPIPGLARGGEEERNFRTRGRIPREMECWEEESEPRGMSREKEG